MPESLKMPEGGHWGSKKTLIKDLYLHEKVPDALDVDPFQGPAEKMRKSALNGIGLSPNIEHNVRIVTDNFDLLK